MTVISSGVVFSAVKSTHVDVHGPGKNAEDSESSQKALGTPMMMQVSLVTTNVRPMSSFELQSAMDFIRGSKDSIKGLGKWGKGFYDRNEKTFKKIKGVFTVIQGLGSIVSGIKKLQPEKEDPMVQNLAELTTEVKALSEKLTDNFAEMKNFISEQTFFTDIMNPTTVLTMHMLDCLAYPGDDSKRNFRMAYENLSPLKMQFHLNAYLMQKTTNPLRVNMDSEKVKSKETFEKWEDIFSRVMAQFVVLEAFADGLLGKKNASNLDRLLESSAEVLDEFHQLKEEYKKDQGYWEEVKAFLVPYMKENSQKDNKQKADDIKAKLESYLTRDAFYICLFGEAIWQVNYTYYCPNEKDQLVGAWHVNGCNAFIYRSRTAYKNDHMMGQLMRNLDVKTMLYWPGTFMNVIKTEFIDKKLLPEDGFTALFPYSLNSLIVHVYQTSDDVKGGFYGPGFSTGQVTMNNDVGCKVYFAFA